VLALGGGGIGGWGYALAGAAALGAGILLGPRVRVVAGLVLVAVLAAGVLLGANH
jgi:hypothetical protein